MLVTINVISVHEHNILQQDLWCLTDLMIVMIYNEAYIILLHL
jgi:hypothetical protein